MTRTCTYVTTKDNPYDYFDEFDKWYAYDTQHGYNTCSLVARIANVSHDMAMPDYDRDIDRAVDTICQLGLIPNCTRVKKIYDVES